jgi:hypothetical protein
MANHLRFLVKRGSSPPKSALHHGEVAYLTDTHELVVGDPTTTMGYVVVSQVVAAPDGRLFADTPDGVIPLCIPMDMVNP